MVFGIISRISRRYVYYQKEFIYTNPNNFFKLMNYDETKNNRLLLLSLLSTPSREDVVPTAVHEIGIIDKSICTHNATPSKRTRK